MKSDAISVFRYVKRTDQLLFQLDFPKVDQQTGGKWLILGTKHHKANI